MHIRAIQPVMARYLKAASIVQYYSPHTLRHRLLSTLYYVVWVSYIKFRSKIGYCFNKLSLCLCYLLSK